MVARLIVALVATLSAAPPAPARAATPAKQMYQAAMAREKTLRARWEDGATGRAGAVIAAYEAIVRRHPTSGYCDNALWQAAVLAADAFAKGRQDEDRRTAVRLFEFLAREYPTSPFATKAADQARRFQTTAAAAPPNAPGAERPARPSRTEGRTAPAATMIRQIRRMVLPEIVRVTLELDREVMFRQERVESPSRLLLDLAATTPSSPLKNVDWAYRDDVVQHIRVGQRDAQTTRVVLDLEGVARYTVTTLYNPYRILVDCERARTNAPPPAGGGGDSSPKPVVGATAAPARVGTGAAPGIGLPRSNSGTGTGSVPASAATTTAANAEAGRPSADGAKSAAPARPELSGPVTNPALRPRKVPAGRKAPETDPNRVSIARQLGLGVSRIVIDPGHGGHDPGAEGDEVKEADVVLDIALRVEKLLVRQPGVEVVLTRRTDVFIPLEERTAIANREQADLFLSIHANASRNPSARGVESYYLNFASNPEAEAVAARENAASDRTMNSLPDIIKAITLNNKVDESKDFARVVQQGLTKRLRTTNKSLKDLGVKQAPFVVLIGASMPSVLAEVSFITNRREGQLLHGDAYRQRIAEALADAVLRYRRSLKSVTSIASQ